MYVGDAYALCCIDNVVGVYIIGRVVSCGVTVLKSISGWCRLYTAVFIYS